MNAKLKAKYEGETYIIQEGFEFNQSCYEKQSNGKGEYKNRGNKKILPVKYTPDFVGKNFIIECKGNPNEAFPIRWKLFKRYLMDKNIKADLFMPRNQKDCLEVIKIIKEKIL